MEKPRRTLSEEQQNVLAHPNVLTTFLYLLDGASSTDEIARRTGFKPLETSVYLDRMKEAGLIGHSRLAHVGGKSKQVIYEVLEPDVDLSQVVPSMSARVALDLVYNKVKADIVELEAAKKLLTHSGIKYAQIRVRPEAFEQFVKLMNSVESFIREQEVPDGEESITFLMIGYKTDGSDGQS